MLAPRRPERFREVAELIEISGLSWAQRTGAPAARDRDAEVILLDTIGELPSTYSLATVVFVGGSIVDRGGHNVLEPAAAGAAVVTGAHTHNFHAIVDLLNEANALVQLPPVEGNEAVAKLTEVLRELLADPQRREELSSRAKALIAANQGATAKTMQLITPLLSAPPLDQSHSNTFFPAKAHSS
jgi:3-deoxy-D-manno-octulosonic-acid transferase